MWPPTTEEGDIACSSGQGEEEEKGTFLGGAKTTGKKGKVFSTLGHGCHSGRNLIAGSADFLIQMRFFLWQKKFLLLSKVVRLKRHLFCLSLFLASEILTRIVVGAR